MNVPSDTIALAAKCIREGNTDELARMAVDLFRLGSHKDPSSRAGLETMARTAHAQLLMLNRQRAAACLEPFVSASPASLSVDRKALERLRTSSDAYPSGLVLAQIANLQYRYFDFREGAATARMADAQLRKDDGPSQDDRLLALYENAIWWARLHWHDKRHADAEALLDETITKLTLALEVLKDPGGAHLLAAFAFDLWASFDLAVGNTAAARRKIYQACFLLRGGPARCSIRLAHALYMAGRIETSRGNDSSEWSRYLISEAVRLFASIKHPFAFRTELQLAQGLCRIGRVEESRQILDRVESQVSALSNDALEITERSYVKADALLTRTWILEYEARINGNALIDWQRCADVAAELTRLPVLPPRLRIEGDLHFGLALIHLERGQKRERGAKLLRKTLKGARVQSLRKIEAAAHFALTEYHLGNGAKTKARVEFRLGADILRTAKSSFLREWRSRLAALLRIPTTHEVRFAGSTLKSVIWSTTHEYLRYQLAQESDRRTLFRRIGVSGPTGFRMLKKHRLLERQSDLGAKSGRR